MSEYIEPLETIIERFRALPGVGKKSASRMAFGILDMSEDEVDTFCDAIRSSRSRIRKCKVCHNISEGELCAVCSNPKRSTETICVVENIKALMAIERIKSFTGVYHVLGGTISPIDGRGPDDINISSLLERISNNAVSEVIVATNPTIDGDTTAMYISKLLSPLGIKTTRFAYGIPVGGDLDYTDEMTLLRAIDGRKEI